MRSTSSLCISLVILAAASCKTASESRVKELTATDLAEEKGWAGRMGLFLSDAEGGGARVTEVAHFGFADVIGVQIGDVITHVNDASVTGYEHFQVVMGRMRKGPVTAWRLTVRRGDHILTLTNQKEFPCSPMDLAGCGPVPSYRR